MAPVVGNPYVYEGRKCKLQCLLRGMIIPDFVFASFTRGKNFLICFCIPARPAPFKKRSTLKGKNLLPLKAMFSLLE